MVEFWMNNLEIHALKKFDADLVHFMLNSISEDEHPDMMEKSIGILEYHGVQMKDAMLQLGEEDEEGKKIELDTLGLKGDTNMEDDKSVEKGD